MTFIQRMESEGWMTRHVFSSPLFLRVVLPCKMSKTPFHRGYFRLSIFSEQTSVRCWHWNSHYNLKSLSMGSQILAWISQRGYFGHILFSFFGFYGGVFSWQIGLPIVWCGVGGGIELFGVAYCCNVRLGKWFRVAFPAVAWWSFIVFLCHRFTCGVKDKHQLRHLHDSLIATLVLLLGNMTRSNDPR